MTPKRIILDCDPGHDDAVAIMLALGSPAIELLGISTVGGNQTLEKVTRNAQSVLVMCGREDVPVYPGASHPLVHQVEVAPQIHGESGLDGVELPEPTVPVRDKHGVDFIIDTFMSEPAGTVTLVATGPLTNVALAVRKEPRIVERAQQVVVMGGAYGQGNWTASAEFNIWVDPEAAKIVFAQEWDTVMVGLDLTHQALVTAAEEEKAREIGSPLANFFIGLMNYFRKSYADNQGFTDPPVHDPCTVAYLIDPTVVETVAAPVDVETQGDLTMGRTVVDMRQPAPAGCRSRVATKLDRERFWGLVLDAIRTLSEAQK